MKPIVNILIIGTGQLGSRYLQGLAVCSTILEIWCLDPSLDSLKTAKERWKEVESSTTKHKIHLIQNFSELPKKIDLAIVATTADVRLQVMQGISQHCSIRYLVLEKVLVQSSHQLDGLQQAIRDVEGIWVNTARRMNTWHQKLRNAIIGSNQVKVYVGNNFRGLACNSVHFLDLVLWWSDEKLVSVDTSCLDITWFESKRSGFFEITGILKAKYSCGSELILESRTNGEGVLIHVKNLEGEWIIDEKNGIATGPKGKTIPGRIEHQSEMTTRLVESILETGQCKLPNIEESAQIHRIFLQSMLDHWNKVHNKNDTFIPIT